MRGALVDFYSVDALSEAEVRLLSDVDAMQFTRKHPHIPLRRTGAGRLGLEADDLFRLFTFLDDMINYQYMYPTRQIISQIYDCMRETCMFSCRY